MQRDTQFRTLRCTTTPIVLSIACLLAFAPLMESQAPKQSGALQSLIQKAQALESRGRPDIAVQVWQQILASDPNNSLALEGVARDYRLSGNSTASDEALDKLRKINPSNPNIGQIRGLTSNKNRDARLGQAGALAKAGNPEGAMKIFRELYGDHPPDGDIAMAYYETLYSTPNGKTEALNAMRALAARNPGDQRFIVTLGRMLTYDSKTRGEGIKILHEHAEDPNAQNSLRQALIWDSSNPTSAAELREYLKSHPNDSELSVRLKENEGKLAEMNSGIARTPAEKAAFAALNAHHLQEAETRFMAMLDEDPKDARAAAGMGFLRMQQNNFAQAISYLVQAEENGFRDRSVVEGLATSRFWFTMGEASLAFDVNQLDVAAQKYQAALDMRPSSPEALQGLAGIYTKNQQYSAAADVYTQILRSKPSSVDAWSGLFFAYARDNKNQEALATLNRFPASVKQKMSQDPEMLRTLASIYQATGREGDAQKVMAQALALPFPDNGTTLKTGTRLQYAGILMQAKRYDQAAELYKQVLGDETDNLNAWMGLVTADHQLGLDKDAIALVEKMPPATYESALSDPGFLSMLGSIYQQSNQFEIAQGLLERSAQIQIKAGGQPSMALQIQLAAIYLQRNDTQQAYALYHKVLEAHPDNIDAWRGLIGTLQATNRNAEALQEIKLISPEIRRQLETDVQFEQSEASLYAAAGDSVNAIAMFNRVQKHYAALHVTPPADVEIQGAYLLYNNFDDRGLYPALMRLGSREDLTSAQRETIQGLWANWSVRRATLAFENGNTARAIDILDAAAQAFPDNMNVRKAVAGGYLKSGKTKDSLMLYKSVDFQDATAGDFQGAISAALAASDKAQAEEWLRQALDRYPKDASILASAARFEQARGDNGRAADYWRASLAAMPEVSPANRLAHELVHPDPERPNSRAATPNDLAHLLNPDSDSMGKTGKGEKLPTLPSYGRDPYDPTAPVPLTPRTSSGTMPRTMPVYPVPTTTNVPLPTSELNTDVAPQPTYRRRKAAGTASVPTTTAASPATSARRTAPRPTSKQTRRQYPPVTMGDSDASVPSDSGSVNYNGRMRLPADSRPTNASPSYGQPTSQTGQNTQPDQQNWQATQPSTQPFTSPSSGPITRPKQNYPALIPQSAPAPRPMPADSLTQNMRSEPLPSPYRTVVPPASQSQSQFSPSNSSTTAGLRLSDRPMSPAAAQAQAMLADQTDGQLTQGFPIHYLSNAMGPAPGYPPPQSGSNLASPPAPLGHSPLLASSVTPYSNAQYTPSAQDAAAGAYSAQKQTREQPAPPPLQPEPQAQQPQQQAAPTQPTSSKSLGKRRRPRATTGNEVPTLVTAPPQQAPIPQQEVTDAPLQGGPATTGAGLTDQELQERNLPPLRGPWARIRHPQPTVVSPRDEAEMQLRQIEGGYSAWLGGNGIISHRTGSAGYDALNALEATFEASVPLGTHARFTVIGRPVFLDSGQADGNALISLTSGVVTAPLGTLSSTAAGTTPPGQQNAAGLAGEAQLTFGNLALAGGVTPQGFLVSNFTARANWRPGGGPLTFTFNRDSVRDTQLSYAGLRDPGSANATFPGNVWGGVIANQANVQFAKGDLASGFYMGAGGQYITGYHVLDNKRIDGSMGAYWRVFTLPEYGMLNVGANFFGMHYTTNLQAFTHGMGGYFSPQAYFLANIPVTWTGHYLTRWHYTVLGSFGVQAFENNAQSLYPLAEDRATAISQNNPILAALTSVGPNYDLRGQVAYAISNHWFVGGSAAANNSRNYTSVNAGFSIRYLFRPQPSTVAGPTGLFQTDDTHALRPLMVP